MWRRDGGCPPPKNPHIPNTPTEWVQYAVNASARPVLATLLLRLAGVINSAELSRLRTLFAEMDCDGDGIITGAQLASGLASLGSQLSDTDMAEFLSVSKARDVPSVAVLGAWGAWCYCMWCASWQSMW